MKEKVGPDQGETLFGELIRDLSLVDLPLKGKTFTWSNKRDLASFARLDRFLISSEWNSIFPLASQSVLPAFILDHSAVLLGLGSFVPKRRPFCFEKI